MMAVPLFGELADQMPRLSPLCGLELGLRATGQRELKCVVEGLAEVLIPADGVIASLGPCPEPEH